MTRTLASFLTLGIIMIGSLLAFTGCSAPDDPMDNSWGNSNNSSDGGYGAMMGFFHEFDDGIAAKHQPVDTTVSHSISVENSIQMNARIK